MFNCNCPIDIYIFDETIKEFPTISFRLDSDANIVHSPDFEKVLVKIQECRFGILTEIEKRGLKISKLHVHILKMIRWRLPLCRGPVKDRSQIY